MAVTVEEQNVLHSITSVSSRPDRSSVDTRSDSLTGAFFRLSTRLSSKNIFRKSQNLEVFLRRWVGHLGTASNTG